MHGVPGTGRSGYIVNARVQGPKIVVSPIIRRIRRGTWSDSTDAKVAIFAVETHRCIVDRLSRFIENVTADHGGGHQSQDKVFSLKCGAGHDSGGVLFVLFVRGRDKSASRPP